MTETPCIDCRLRRECTPEGLEFEPCVCSEPGCRGYGTFVCPCECHPKKPLNDRLADERHRPLGVGGGGTIAQRVV
jgi:hypothetical protein